MRDYEQEHLQNYSSWFWSLNLKDDLFWLMIKEIWLKNSVKESLQWKALKLVVSGSDFDCNTSYTNK